MSLRNEVIRLVSNVPHLRGELLPLLKQSGRIPRSIFITPQDVKANLELYWSPLRQALYPAMMGHGSARTTQDIAEDIVWGFLFKTGNAFEHSPWRQNKAKELKDLILQTMGAAGKVAKNLAHNLSLEIYNRSSGSNYWGFVFRTSDIVGTIKALRRPPHPEMAKVGITRQQMAVIADWLEQYVKDLKAWESKLDKYVSRKVRPVLKKLIPQADQGIPPEQWSL